MPATADDHELSWHANTCTESQLVSHRYFEWNEMITWSTTWSFLLSMDDLIERTWTQMNSLQPSKGSDVQDPARPLKKHVSERIIEAINATQILARSISKPSSNEVWQLFFHTMPFRFFPKSRLQYLRTNSEHAHSVLSSCILNFSLPAASRWVQSWSEHESGHHQIDKGGKRFL